MRETLKFVRYLCDYYNEYVGDECGLYTSGEERNEYGFSQKMPLEYYFEEYAKKELVFGSYFFKPLDLMMV